MSDKKILDVGCGRKKIPAAIGIDQYAHPVVDVVHNLENFPWPFRDGEFDHIVFNHSISHLPDTSRVLTECYRLLRDQGCIEIVVPHYSSDNFNTDPTHKVHLGARSMNYFVDNVDFGYRYIDQHIHFVLERATISFRENATSWRTNRKINPFCWIGVEWLACRYPRLYERFFCGILPLSEVYYRLRCNKGSS